MKELNPVYFSSLLFIHPEQHERDSLSRKLGGQYA